MPFIATPTNWFPGWSEDGTSITVPITTFTELTAAEADAASGDIRKIMYAICQQAYAKNLSLPTAEKPTKMVISKNATFDATTGILTSTFTFKFLNEIISQDVAPE